MLSNQGEDVVVVVVVVAVHRQTQTHTHTPAIHMVLTAHFSNKWEVLYGKKFDSFNISHFIQRHSL